MKHVFQLISKQDGTRSEPFLLTRSELVKVLKESSVVQMEEQVVQMELDEFYVLVIQDVDESNNVKLSQAPLMLASTLVSMFDFEVTKNG